MKIVWGLIITSYAQIEGSTQIEGSADFNDLETCQKSDIAIECNIDSIKIRKINLASTCSGTFLFRHAVKLYEKIHYNADFFRRRGWKSPKLLSIYIHKLHS